MDQHPQEPELRERHWAEVAPNWWRWRHVMSAASLPVSEKMVEMARIGPGSRVLDVASGLGEPALTAAARVAPDGLVIATDLSAEMTALAARRARDEGVDRVVFARMDGTRPALRAASMDAVLCRWGLMSMPLDAALSGFLEVLKPGGRLAAAVWGPPDSVPSLAVPLAAARAAVGGAPPVAGENGPFRLAGENVLADAVRAAGFARVTVTPVTVSYLFESVEDQVRYCKEAASPIASLVRDATEADRARIWDAVTAAVSEYADAGGRVRMDNQAICLAAAHGAGR